MYLFSFDVIGNHVVFKTISVLAAKAMYYVSSSHRLRFVVIQTAFYRNTDCVLPQYRLRFTVIQTTFHCHTDCVSLSYRLRSAVIQR